MTVEKLQEVFGEWPLRVGKFEKVSYEQFRKDWLETFAWPEDEKLRSEELIKDAYNTMPVPVRADDGSSGFDFYSPLNFDLIPNKDINIPTGIKVQMLPGWYLSCHPRSSLGFKYYCRLSNTTGIIDASYYNNPKNEGHCFIKIRNESTKIMIVRKGDRFCQGIFNIHGITYDDNASGTRTGGLGSSGK